MVATATSARHGTKVSKVEYDRLIAEFLANGRQPLHTSPSGITVVELCARYIDYAKRYYRKKNGVLTTTSGSVVRDLKLLSKLYGRLPAAEFGPLALKAIRQRMVGEGQSRNYVNDRVARIKRMFKWAVGEQLVPPSTFQALAAVGGLSRGRSEARETPPILPVEAAVVDSTLKHLPVVVADMVRFQRFTGCRPAEVCIIRPCDVDRSADVWTYKPESHKTEHHGHERMIFIGPQAQAVLLRYLARDAKTHCFQPVDSEAKRLAAVHKARITPLSCGNRPGTNRKGKPKRQPGNHYQVPSYRRAIHRACDKAFPHPELGSTKRLTMTSKQIEELKQWQSSHRWSPNQLRHAAATKIRSEFGLEAAQVALGHRTADVTQVYAERDAAKGMEVARMIG